MPKPKIRCFCEFLKKYMPKAYKQQQKDIEDAEKKRAIYRPSKEK